MALQPCEELTPPVLLDRVAELPVLQYQNQKQLLSYGSLVPEPEKPCLPMFFDNSGDPCTQTEEFPSIQCFCEKELPLQGGKAVFGRPDRQGACAVSYLPDEEQPGSGSGVYFVYDLKELLVGFLRFSIDLEEEAVVDVAYCEQILEDGTVSSRRGFKTCLRTVCPKGHTVFTSFEPYTPRYIKIIVRSQKAFTLRDVGVVRWHYPDLQQGSFLCDREDVNRLYEAARRTLQINTLDIFMDCCRPGAPGRLAVLTAFGPPGRLG